MPDRSKRRRYLRQYAQWLGPYKWSLALVFFLSLLTTALDLAWPLVIMLVIDKVLARATGTPADYHLLNVLGLAILALLLLKQIADTTRSHQLTQVNAKLVYRLRSRLLNSLLKLPLSQLAEMKGGGIVTRLSGDVDAASGLIRQALIDPAVAVVRVLLTAGVLIYVSWRLAASALVLLPPLIPLTYIWLARVRPLYRAASARKALVDGRTVETFGGIRVVRAFRREKREQSVHAAAQHSILRDLLRAARMELLLEAGWGLLVPAASLLIVWYGGLLVLRGQASVGDLFLFQMYAVLLLAPIFQIILAFSQTQKALAAMERVFDALEMPADKPDLPDAIDAPEKLREIRLDNVGFSYAGNSWSLRDVSLTVPAGSTIALVGPSGAGKSTLADLLARFHDPTEGSVLINGIDLRKLKLASYRKLLAVVPQDVFLFDGSARQNIAYGCRGATEQQIIEAAQRANAHEFISALPDGYDTPVGERGFKLSGGQKQRLSIARAILADPQILILDEATSNLDTESEQLIQASLAELFRHRTTFVIAHRLSTVARADLIVVMNQGRVTETGTHESLMAADGMYAEMVDRQRQAVGALDAALP
jgi:ATP-binding cassette subfamily B protein/subfamily B ATP-binding cassette protein MsbA